MLILKLQPLTDAFDWLHVAWEHAATQRRVAFCILWVYLLALLGVELRRQGLLPPWLAAMTPASHFYAIHLAFTLILVLEVMGLILVIPSSLSQSMGKQFEILTLILLRNAFKELAHLPEPVSVVNGMQPVYNIAVSGAGALCVYLCLGLYRRMARRHPHFIQTPQLRMGYVLSKKLLALTLFCVFLVIGIRDFILFIRTGADQNFFETLYTVLIFADIALVLIAQRYMPAFHAVFRNSGFVIGTLLMRLALSASPLWSPAIGLFAALFVLALTWGTNYFTPDGDTPAAG
ncbi:hypothetical protein [Desulfovibrio legallii]|jgi:hypothetical protein|uniref:Uncharacterized protein n=1 Tax=Desulfovibrio legallii TaxID=571438 RepID=A0A1G7L3Y1_9BACT|nr:hypothetical protein [Desulfovibrio legallii]SDF44091.1 hypothetical protein SAMN05192586_105110 [Desulfovibrio legallii]